jgi:hypothetical protein
MGKSELDSCTEPGTDPAETRFDGLVTAGVRAAPGTAGPLAKAMREWLQDVGPDGAGVLDAGGPAYRSLVELCKLVESLASDSNPFPWISRSKVYEKVTSVESGGGEERKVVNQQAIAQWLRSRESSLRGYPKVVAMGWMPKVDFDGFTGGRGKSAQLRITYERIELAAAAGPVDSSTPVNPIPGVPNAKSSGSAGLIAYEARDAVLSVMGRMMFGQSTLPLRSARGVVIIGSALGSAITALLLGLAALLVITTSGAAGSQKAFLISIAAILEAAIVWYFGARPWWVLVEDRIKMADELWTSFSRREAQIELLRRDGRRHVRIVQYRSTCSVCGSDVHIEPGRREFDHRLVGRCAESPREHVFSFDRVTKLGYPLRQSPASYRQ